ncbi:hypothetical protein [Rickettsiella endosymbiont of Dermanyssus gallinae]|uniref:hypothetical protein n=1 Tax=Rickettsiella endosymbiont of Dermanyssus gallinae TaxID=2856608 RepID=UPI001C52D06F|nr:hypothetical protein [Rickettsiella endosymbiont of Dermanyssus gallinae]
MFHRPYNNPQVLRSRLAEMTHSNQVLIQQFNQLCQHMQWALEENRTLRREIIELTRDLNSMIHDHISSQQRYMTLQQELTTKTSRIGQLEGHMIRLQEKITVLETQLTQSIARGQIITPNPGVATHNIHAHSSSTNAPNNP